MPEPITLVNFRDTYVNSGKPNRAYNSVTRLRLKSGEMYAYLYFAKPMPPGATIISAKLRVWNDGAIATSTTLTAERLSGKWAATRTTWNNKPGVSGPTYTVTKATAADKTMWEIDLTSLMQLISNGGAWYGVRLITNQTTMRKFFSSEAEDSDYRPQLVLEWTDAPEAPDNLSPSGNLSVYSAKPILTYAFTDNSGDQTLAAHNIQLSTDPAFGTTVYDSGWLATTEPQFDLSTTAYAGLADGASIYWRVRVRDGAGAESSWSSAAQFSRTTKGTLASSSLGGSGPYYVNDTTPTAVWSLTGRTQAKFRVAIFDLENLDEALVDSGQITSTATSFDTGGLADRVLTSTTKTYRLVIQVWDTIARVKTPNETIYYEYVQDFVYQAGAQTAPVMGSVATVYPYPYIDVTFTSATPPDSFTIIRDDEVVEANILPGDILVSGTTYKYRDRTAAPRVQHTWKVIRNVNGVDSPASSGASLTSKPAYTWMMNLDGSSPVCLLKSASERTPLVDISSSTSQEVFQPIGGSPPVLITQFLSGFEGHVDAVIADDATEGLITAREMRDRFKKWKRNPGQKVLLYVVDEVMTVVPYNMQYRPRAKSGGQVIYDISFDFFQVNY